MPETRKKINHTVPYGGRHTVHVHTQNENIHTHILIFSSCSHIITKLGEVVPKKASRGSGGVSPQPPEAGFLGRFR